MCETGQPPGYIQVRKHWAMVLILASGYISQFQGLLDGVRLV